jgi:putative transposase
VICLSKDRRQLLEPEHKELSIRRQCEILRINRSNIYYVRKPIDTEQLKLMRVIDEVYTQYPFFGSRQMVSYLRPMGYDIGRSQVRSIYEKLGLRAICPGPHTSKPHPEHKVYPYLLKDVEIVARNQVWSTDITFLPLRKGFVYLMAIMDWFSRYVLDWDISISLEADFCIETLGRLLTHKNCEIFNTDQGSQFTSNGFIGLLLAKGIKISMDGRGRAFDNIFVERLWRSVKYECIYLHEWETVREIKQGLIRYFDFYNNKRPHQGLGGVTPASVYLDIK